MQINTKPPQKQKIKKHKSYVAMIDKEKGEMIVPIKARLNPYNNKPAFCAGMPQFFGGTHNSSRPPLYHIQKEVNEESRGTYELEQKYPTSFYKEDNMEFFVSDKSGWEKTEKKWTIEDEEDEDKVPPEQKEMEDIKTVDLKKFNAEMKEDEIIEELIKQTNTSEASEQAQKEFNESATRQAYINIISNYTKGN